MQVAAPGGTVCGMARAQRASASEREPGSEPIHLDRTADVPLGVQLAWALRSRIAAGALSPGQRLPALRELAAEVGLNLNTVRAVYQRLEREGLISTQQGRGTFVASGTALRSAAGEIAAGAARAAREHGVSPREVAAALYVSQAAPRAADGEAERRETLRGEITSLERLLSGLEAAHPGLLAPPRAARTRGPSLLDAAELEAVRAHLVQRLAALQRAIDGEGEDEDPPAADAARSAGRAPKARRRPATRPATAST
jgi:GntR family transcriptional regulator